MEFLLDYHVVHRFAKNNGILNRFPRQDSALDNVSS